MIFLKQIFHVFDKVPCCIYWCRAMLLYILYFTRGQDSLQMFLKHKP
jgi:hypothetical protein